VEKSEVHITIEKAMSRLKGKLPPLCRCHPRYWKHGKQGPTGDCLKLVE
jgi:hypothetical protein